MDERIEDFPFVTTALAVSIVAMAWFVTGFFPTMEDLSAVWWDEDAFANGEWWRAVTAILAHGGILHLGVNLLALISFGPIVERRIGSLRFLGLFLGAGFSSLLAHALYRPDLPVVGASGSIFGILGLLMILAPRMRMALFFVLDVRILTFGALYAAFVPILLQLDAGAFIAHEAHLGGMVFGTATAFLVDWRKALHVMPAAITVFLFVTLLVTSWVRLIATSGCDLIGPGLFHWIGCTLQAAWSDAWLVVVTVVSVAATVGAYWYLEKRAL